MAETESTRSGSVEKRQESPSPPPTTKVGSQGSLHRPTVEVGSVYTKSCPFALGNCVSTRAAQTLWTAIPDKQFSNAWINSRSILDIYIPPLLHFSSLSLPYPRLVTLVIGLSKQTYLIHCLDTCSTPPSLHSFLSLWNNQAI